MGGPIKCGVAIDITLGIAIRHSHCVIQSSNLQYQASISPRYKQTRSSAASWWGSAGIHWRALRSTQGIQNRNYTWNVLYDITYVEFGVWYLTFVCKFWYGLSYFDNCIQSIHKHLLVTSLILLCMAFEYMIKASSFWHITIPSWLKWLTLTYSKGNRHIYFKCLVITLCYDC